MRRSGRSKIFLLPVLLCMPLLVANADLSDKSPLLTIGNAGMDSGGSGATKSGLASCASGYEAAVMGLSPVGYWRLGESSGTTAVDETGANNGTYVGPTLGSPGAISNDADTAADFDGVNDSVDVGTFDVSGTGLTIAAWFSADDFDIGEARLISKTTGTSTASHIWMLSTVSSGGEYRLRARVKAGGSTSTLIASSGAISTNQWYFGVLTYDGSNMTLFLDGQQLNSLSKSGAVSLAPTVSTWIGDNSSGIGDRPFDGPIDDVAIFDYALSAADVSDLYDCATAASSSDSQWTFDETTGTSAIDAISANTGTYVNGPLLDQAGACPATGTSVSFDGSNDYVDIPHGDGYLLDDGAVTFWAKADSLGSDQSLFSKDSNGFDTGGHLTIYLDASGAVNVRLQSTTTSYLVTSSPIVAGEWFHVAFNWGASGMKLTIDASEEVTDPYTGGLGTSSGGSGNYEPIAVGANSWTSGDLVITPLSNYFDGFIDDVQIHSASLSDAEIDAMICSTPSPFSGRSRWLMDETSSTVMADAMSYQDGVYVNGPQLNQAGQCNQSVHFDGSNDYVEIAHADGYLLDAGTVTFWANADSLGSDKGLFGKDSTNYDTGGHLAIRLLSSGQVTTRLQSTTTSYTITSSTSVTPGDWFHVAFSWGPGGMVLTVDATEQITNAYTGGLGTTSGGIGNYEPIAIGANTWASDDLLVAPLSGYFAGYMDDIRIYDYELTLSEIQTVATCAELGSTHFGIGHDGAGVNCQAENVTISSHDSAHTVNTGYTGTITLSTSSSHGDWSLVSGAGTLDNAPADDGVATYAFDAADNGTAVLGLSDTYAETVNINVTDGGAIEDTTEDNNLVFASSGFNFLADATKNAIGTQIGGKASNVAPGAQTLALEAVRTNDDTGACEAAFTGVNSVDLAFECEDPSTCTARQVSISGTYIAANPNGSVSSYTAVDLDFGDDTDTTATISVSYPDVGQLQLHARTTLSPSGETMAGASNSFVVRPFALHMTAAGNPSASSSAGSAFTNAGIDFTTTVNAVLWSSSDDGDNDGIADNHDDTDPSNNADLSDNAVAPNYGQESAAESVSLTALLDQPSGGTDPGLSGGTTIAAFGAGSGATSTVRYDEVGIIEMTAVITDGDYLGIGAPVTAGIVGKSGYVGRFNPARYAVTTSGVTAACSSIFTYARQPFNGSLTLQAQNGSAGGNARTANYLGGFVTLDPATELILINDQTAGSYDLQTIGFTQDFDAGTTGEAVLALQLRWDMSQQAPVVSTAQITGVTDEVTVIAGAPVDIGFSSMRYGRIALTGALGSELVNLAVPMRAEYFVDANTDFVINSNDSCSSAVTASFSNYAGNLLAGDTCVLDTGSPGVSGAGCAAAGPVPQRYAGPPVGGDFNLFLQASGAGNDGSVTVDVDVPDWLKFDWDAAAPGDENPSTRATFGIYSGSDQQIYRRELY